MEEVRISVDGLEVWVKKGGTVMEACEKAGKEIPRYCYHKRLRIAGNCRICMVEVEGEAKTVVSCAREVRSGMKVYTGSGKVKKAREGVMEMILINHPLDCPICDQGGECDLQDQSMKYGSDRARYYKGKRGVEDKEWGLVKTVMTRCIQCTRCVRYMTEIVGEELGMVGRGVGVEVGRYKAGRAVVWRSHMIGNVIDMCPVGNIQKKEGGV